MKMESNQNTKSTESQQNSSKAKTMMESLNAIGAKLVIKKGSILMPLSKKQRERMKK